jgi:large conductance mechanosensitive channel
MGNRVINTESLNKIRGSSVGFLKEFRSFAVKGNVVDLAVGIIIGAAFGKIVTSLVADVVMPPIGAMIGGVNFSSLAITIKEATDTLPAVQLKYGAFLQTVFDFMIVAAAVFMLVKGINKLKRQEAAKPVESAPVPPTDEVRLLSEIRDLLAKR